MSQNTPIEDDEVLDFFSDERTLLDALVKGIHIYELEQCLTIDIDIQLLRVKSDKDYRIRFKNVIEYAFYHTNDLYFYYIANLKFLNDIEAYYISMDPDDSILSRSENDNNFILSRSISAILLSV